MVQRLPTGYVFDPEDPRAPSLDQWERMLPDERARMVAMLPADVPLDLLREELAGKLAEEQRLREEDRRLREEDRRLREDAERQLAAEHRLREDVQQRLAEALAENERLKKKAT